MPVLQVRLDKADHDKMKEIADAAGVSASEQVRLWINNRTSTTETMTTALVMELRDEVKRLKKDLAARPATPPPTPTIRPVRPKVATVPIREPVLTDREDSPFRRPSSFGQYRPAPKPLRSK